MERVRTKGNLLVNALNPWVSCNHLLIVVPGVVGDHLNGDGVPRAQHSGGKKILSAEKTTMACCYDTGLTPCVITIVFIPLVAR